MSEDAALYLTQQTMEQIAQRSGIPIYDLFPSWYADRLFSVNGAREAGEISYRMGGRAVRPKDPVVLIGPDGKTPILLVGAGETEAAELEELAQAVYEKGQRRISQGKTVIPFDEIREKRGYPAREKFSDLFKQALTDRMERHRRNPRSDPPKQHGTPTGGANGTTQ